MEDFLFKEVGLERIKNIREEGWGQIDFIEVVFKEWVKLNQSILDREYTKQNNIARKDGDLDHFTLWLVDNIYLQVYCKSNDSRTVKEFCVKHFNYKEGSFSPD